MKIKCSVPWPISYCYALDPVGNYTYATGFSADRMQKIGVCHVSIEVQSSDTFNLINFRLTKKFIIRFDLLSECEYRFSWKVGLWCLI